VDIKEHITQRRNFWNINRIYQTVHDYDLAYGNLQPEFIRRVNPALYSNSHRYFKSWSELLKEFKFDLQRNLIKTALEPLRTTLVLEYVKKIYDILGKDYNIKQLDLKNRVTSKPEELKSVLELQSKTGPTCITSSYRSWSYDLEIELFDLLTRYTNVLCFYSIGEPRQWVNNKVQFINLNQAYDELSQVGRDDIISAIGKLYRGDVPDEYRDQFSNAINDVKKQIQNTEKTTKKN
jgi:hypothetical protein